MSCVVCLGTRAGLTRAEHSAHGMAVLLLSVAARALDPRHPRMLTRCCACVAKSLARGVYSRSGALLATLASEEGVKQGCPVASFGFALKVRVGSVPLGAVTR